MSPRRTFLGALASAAVVAAVELGPARLAWAGSVEVTATLGREQIPVGQSVYLQVEVATDGAGAIGEPRFPTLEGVELSARGSSSGVSVQFDGRQSVRRTTKTFTYVLTPRSAGTHEITVEVEIGGQLHRAASKPTLIATSDDFVPEVEHDKAGDQPASAEEEVIVWPVVDKSKVYVGEQVIYEMQVWDRGRGKLTISSLPTFKDFWSEDIMSPSQQQRPRTERKLLDGVPYRVDLAMRRALFPQKAGTLTIGGPELEQQMMSGPFFGRSGPPRSFIGRSLAIEVEPLPAKGQPPGFRANNVGTFRIGAEVDRTQLRQGEALRLSVRIAGTGNIALVALPELPELEGLRSYEPKPETPKLVLGKEKLRGSRVYTMLLVADEPGRVEIPAIELPYFDPDKGEYAVARSKAIVLEVEANADAAAPPEAGERRADSAESASEELLAPVIASAELARITPRARWLSAERWWIGTLAAPATLGLGWLVASLRERFGPDDDAQARAREQSRRRTLLNQANVAVDAGENFYPTLASLLQSAAVSRAGPAGVGLTRARLMTLLSEQGVAEDEVDQLRELLDACDAARFGSGSGDASQRREHLEQARALLGRRSWRPR